MLEVRNPTQSKQFSPTMQDRFSRWLKTTYQQFQILPPSPTQEAGLRLLRDSQRRQEILFQAILIRLGSPPPKSLVGQLAEQAAQVLFRGGDPS